MISGLHKLQECITGMDLIVKEASLRSFNSLYYNDNWGIICFNASFFNK